MLVSPPRSSPGATRATPGSASPSAANKTIATAETGFGITKDGLAEIVLEKDVNLLARYGGVKGVVRKLRADPERGLRTDVVSHHRTVFGENSFPSRPMRAFPLHWLDALNDIVLLALIVSACVTIGFGVAISGNSKDMLLGVGIVIAVTVVSLVGATQSWRQERQLRVLAELKNERAVTLLRDGIEQRVSVHAVVVGDVFVLRAGDVLPVDGLFLSGNGLRCDESDITGEAFPVPKGSDSLFLVGGARVMGGAGTMLVLTTGMDTTYGQLVAALDEADPPPTPLEETLELVATRIGYAGLLAGVAVFLVLILSFLVKFYPLYTGAFLSILSFFIMGVTVIVVAVPEGLPLALTLTLVNSMRCMLAERLHVKEAATLEQLGLVTAVVTDKTGALTQNVMTVARGWVFGVMHDDVPDTERVGGPARRDLLARCIANNSDAVVRYSTDALRAFSAARSPGLTAAGTSRDAIDTAATAALAAAEMIGSRTEVALLHMLRLNYDIDFAYVRRAAGLFVYRENFSPARARMTTIFAPASPGGSAAPFPTIAEGGAGELAGVPTGYPGCGRYTVYIKGAPESVVALCAHYVAADGSLVPLEARRRETVLAMVDLIASRGLRPIALATRTIDPAMAPPGHDSPGESGQHAWAAAVAAGSVESGAALVAIVGLRDLLRPGTAAAVAACRGGGIKVRLATGEHTITAKALATDAGIFTAGVVLDGSAWRAMAPEDRSAVIPRLEVLARATPSDKLLLVQALAELGEVVVATGDGTDDGTVLKAAAVGAAMGVGATHVAKDAAKLVVQDGSLATLVRAVLWGRAVIESIRKFLVFQVTINVVAVLLTIVASVQHMGADLPFPLEAIQLLWVNLIMDSFGALMLATEAPDEELLVMLPQDKALPLFSRTMIKAIVLQGAYQLGLCCFLAFSAAGASVFGLPASLSGSRLHQTCVFNAFVWLSLFNFFNARRLHDQWNLVRGLSRNAFGLGVLAALAALQVFFVEVGGAAMRTEFLTAQQFLTGVGLGATVLLVGAFVRWVPYRDAVFLAASGGKVGPGVSSWGLTLTRGGLGGTTTARSGGVASFFGGGGSKAATRVAPTPYAPWTASDVPEGERSRLTGGGVLGPLHPQASSPQAGFNESLSLSLASSRGGGS